jgi:hypothetical protein
MERIGFPETSVGDFHYTLHNNPEERNSVLFYVPFIYLFLSYPSVSLFFLLTCYLQSLFLPER